MISPYLESILVFVGINTILALGNFIPYSAGLHSLGQAGFMAVGAYTAALLTKEFSVPFLPALLAGGGLALVVGFLVGLPVLRVRGIYLVLVTWGFAEAIRIILLNLEYVGGPGGIGGIYPSTNLLTVYVCIFLLVIFCLRLQNSRIGRAFQAVDMNQEAAEAMGIDLTKIKLTAFSLGAFICGIGGGLYAHYALYIEPSNFNFFRSAEILFFCVLGGGATFVGPIVGAIIFTVFPEIFRFLHDWRVVFFGLVLIGMMIFRPQGLVSRDLCSMAWSVLGRFLRGERFPVVK
jgi:branched-chain amino acid transport system permease protein